MIASPSTTAQFARRAARAHGFSLRPLFRFAVRVEALLRDRRTLGQILWVVLCGALPRPVTVFVGTVYAIIACGFLLVAAISPWPWLSFGAWAFALWFFIGALNQLLAASLNRVLLRMFYEVCERMGYDVGETTNERELRKMGRK